MPDRTTRKKHDPQQRSDIVRRFKQNPLTFVGTILVLVIVIIAFVFVPAIVPDGGGADELLEFGAWDRKPIAYTSGGYFANMRAQYENMRRYYQMSDEQIWRNAFEAAASRTAILGMMDAAGYDPPKTRVDAKVADLDQFKENGRFSAVKYGKLDPATRIRLWQDVRMDMITERYRDDAGALKTPKAEEDFIADMSRTQRTFKMASFPYSSFPDTELIVYADRHPDTFKTLRLAQITVSGGEAGARGLRDGISGGDTTFEDTARTQSEDEFADRGGSAGPRLAFELEALIADEELRASVAGLAAGELSEVIPSGSNWIIFKAEEAAAEPDLGDAGVLAKVRGYLLDNERGIIEDWLLKEAEAFAGRARAGGFEEVAAEEGIELAEFGPVPLNYGNSDLFTTLSASSAPGLDEAATDENFWKTAFATPSGEPSAPIVLGGADETVAVFYPVEEQSETAADNTRSTFTGWWLDNETRQNITDAILNSKRFDNRFEATYSRLFSGT